MTDFYRFPAMARLDTFTTSQQMQHIMGELYEANTARLKIEIKKPSEKQWLKARNDYGMELMDIIHACETALRMEFTDEEIDELHEAVEDKNRERGYYG